MKLLVPSFQSFVATWRRRCLTTTPECDNENAGTNGDHYPSSSAHHAHPTLKKKDSGRYTRSFSVVSNAHIYSSASTNNKILQFLRSSLSVFFKHEASLQNFLKWHVFSVLRKDFRKFITLGNLLILIKFTKEKF